MSDKLAVITWYVSATVVQRAYAVSVRFGWGGFVGGAVCVVWIGGGSFYRVFLFLMWSGPKFPPWGDFARRYRMWSSQELCGIPHGQGHGLGLWVSVAGSLCLGGVVWL